MTTIDWSRLDHAYGSAADIPALLARARTDPAPDERLLSADAVFHGDYARARALLDGEDADAEP